MSLLPVPYSTSSANTASYYAKDQGGGRVADPALWPCTEFAGGFHVHACALSKGGVAHTCACCLSLEISTSNSNVHDMLCIPISPQHFQYYLCSIKSEHIIS